MPDIKNDILVTLAYFDRFQHPLTRHEIYLFLPNIHSMETFRQALYELLSAKTIFNLNGYYSLKNNFSLVERRKTGYQKALILLRKAEKIAAILSLFPFVRGVGVSGSLSKYYADDNSDIDFFIITASNRVWLARSLTHLLKKVSFLFKRQHFFCMNYYIDEQALEIVEKNIFTATEIVTLIPLKGTAIFSRFYAANQWTREMLPNYFMRVSTTTESKAGMLKKAIEALAGNALGEAMDNMLMRLTGKRWREKTMRQQKNDHGMVMRMDVNKHYSKPAASSFQADLINSYRHRIAELLQPDNFPEPIRSSLPE